VWRLVLCTVLLQCLFACASSHRPEPAPAKKVHPIAAQAQFDLNCRRSEIGYLKIADDQWGAVGCGKRARYRRVCQDRPKRVGAFGGVEYEARGCHWLLDSPVMQQEAKPEPASAPSTESSGI